MTRSSQRILGRVRGPIWQIGCMDLIQTEFINKLQRNQLKNEHFALSAIQNAGEQLC